MGRNGQCSLTWAGVCVAAMMCTSGSLGQDFPRREIDAAHLVDEIFPLQDLDVNYGELYETLLQYLSTPLDLNQASEEELRSLFVLREEQLNALLTYREKNGPFFSVYELQSVPTLDLATLYNLVQFVVVTDQSAVIDRSLLNRILNENNNYFISRYSRVMEPQKGYRSTTDSSQRYAGSPGNLYFRYRVSRPGDFSFGLTGEKDAGEALRWSPPQHYYGMDYYSFHGQLLNKGRLKNLVVGDYLAQFGQGLALGGGFGMGLGAETITTVRRSSLGFIPYASVRETGFFRGLAASVALRKNLTWHVFGSRMRRDGTSSADTTDQNYAISSLEVTGYHRTPSELASRKQVVETNFGSVVSYRLPAGEGGIIFHQTHFSDPINRNPTPYNQFTFGGTLNTNVSAFFNYTWSNVAFFTEVAQTLDHGQAFVAGTLASLTRHLDLALLCRHYARDFYSFYSNAIAENSIPQNESGIYWGWKYVFSKKYSLAGYTDLFSFPWLRYRGYAPSTGSENLARFTYQPSKTILFFVQARQEIKIRNFPEDSNLYLTGPGVKRNCWINLDYAAGSGIGFKTRMQFSSYTLAGKTTRGVALAQDLNLEAGRLSFSARYMLFSTDDYDNRLYQYERDAWLAVTFPSYYGTGLHTYLLMRARVASLVDVWIRWSHTRYTNRTTIGSEGETINGNTRNDLTLQTVMRF